MATLNLAALAPSTTVTVSFDLYSILSPDGDGQSGGGGADFFRVNLNGASIFNETIANAVRATQSYGGAGSAAGTGRDTSLDNALGYTFNQNGVLIANDTTYHIVLTATGAFTGPLTLAFIGNSTQEATDEFFGIDNLVVSTNATTAVPGPIAGAGLIPRSRG